MREMKESHIPFCENIPINWSEIPNKYIFSCHSTKVGDKSSEYQLLSLTTSGVKEKAQLLLVAKCRRHTMGIKRSKLAI